ncbi:MAG: disulfide bond formation protein DsbB [Candidatus Paceibacteria bacterium]|jgi:disulfide bond formation protein DsbB
MNEESLTNLIALLGIAAHIFMLVVAVLLMTGKKIKALDFLGKNGIILAFIVSLTAMLGSLYYSEIVGYEPCTLCWYQRIFSYPSVFILAVALWNRKKDIIPYVMFLSGIGAVIALYHSYIQIQQITSVVCGVGEYVSCEETYFLLYGYVTIPILSLTTFLLTMLFLHLSKENA